MIHSPHFCYVPFMTLILNANGTVSTCRELGTDHVIGDLRLKTIEEIWNDRPIKLLRQEFLQGNVKTCALNQSNKKCNILAENLRYKNDVMISESIPLEKIIRLTPDLNGECNLRCIMCKVWKFPNGLYDKYDLWPYLIKNLFPFIKEIDLLSGEPFIQHDTFRLINEISAINPTCRWRFTTNGHWVLTEQISQALDKINIGYISVSLDSIHHQTYLDIRGGNLNQVLENLHALKSYRQARNQKFDLLINFTIMKKNWQELPALLRIHHQYDASGFAQLLYEPTSLSLLSLSDDERIEILKYYLKNLTDRELFLAHRILRALIKSLKRGREFESFYDVVTSNFFKNMDSTSHLQA